MQSQDANRPQRIKIIIITIIIAIIVFIFGAWLITSAIKTVEKKQASQTTEVAKDNKKDEKPTTETKPNETKPAETNTNKSETKTTSPAAQYNTNHQVVDQKTDMPNTGPEDLLSTAILIGLASFLFFKNREIKTKLLARGLKA